MYLKRLYSLLTIWHPPQSLVQNKDKPSVVIKRSASDKVTKELMPLPGHIDSRNGTPVYQSSLKLYNYNHACNYT